MAARDGAAKEGEAHAAAARHYKLVVEERMAKARKMKEEHMIKEQRVAKERKIMHERAVRAAEHGQHSTRGRASSVVEHPPAARKILKRLPEAEKKLDAKKVKVHHDLRPRSVSKQGACNCSSSSGIVGSSC